MTSLESSEKELTLSDVLGVLHRQYKTILGTFLIGLGLGSVYIFSSPTLYTSKVDLLIGSKNYYSGTINNYPIESTEQITHIYSQEGVTITPIKNTSIIQISASNVDLNQSRSKALSTANKIIATHEIMLDDFMLGAQENKLLRKSTSITYSKIIGDITTSTFKYGSPVQKRLSLVAIISGILALLVGICRDLFKRYPTFKAEDTLKDLSSDK